MIYLITHVECVFLTKLRRCMENSSWLHYNSHGDGGLLHANAKGPSQMHDSKSEWNGHGDGHLSYGDTMGHCSHSRTSGSQVWRGDR